MRILCVDDHVVVLAGLTAIINQEDDMEVVGCATSGTEAAEQYRRHRPDVTLMDLQLPGMSGFQAIRAIRAEDPNARIVVLTMFQGKEDVYRALDAGASAYLLKDTLADNLIRVVREVQAGRDALALAVRGERSCVVDGPSVTPREAQVLECIAEGMRNKEIAAVLGVTEDTVQAHMKNIFSKLDVHDRTAALSAAIRQGIIHLK
jgi:two-component system NarL family response regulator